MLQANDRKVYFKYVYFSKKPHFLSISKTVFLCSIRDDGTFLSLEFLAFFSCLKILQLSKQSTHNGITGVVNNWLCKIP